MQQLKPSEISELIKSKIQSLALSAEARTQGTVVSVTDGICRVHGLSDVMQGEMLEFPNNTFGLALNLERDSVGAVILGAVAATAIAFATPVIRTAAWLPTLPSVVQWYLTQDPLSKFTLLPWAGFVFAGVVCGTWIWHGARSSTSVGPDSPAAVIDDGRVMGLMAIGGAALTGVSWWASFQPSIYSPPASFWSTSPTYFGLRVGLMMMTLAALWVCVPLARRVPAPFAVLERLGRDSLFIYWIHVELVYGYLTWPLHRRLSVWGALVAWVLLSWGMYRSLNLRDQWRARWQARRAR